MRQNLLILLLAAWGGLSASANPVESSWQDVVRREQPLLRTDFQTAPLQTLGPETPVSRDLARRLNRYAPMLHAGLKDWPAAPGAKYFKLDHSKEHAVRQNAAAAFTLALLATQGCFDSAAAGCSHDQAEAGAAALLRYLAITHRANFLPTGDGQPWGDHWQSAFWAATAGKAAWMMWNRLPEDTRLMAARMIEHEADRFNERPPDDGEWLDSKAEENGWNSEIMAVAACCFPRHPRAALWHERAQVYMFNAYSTAADRLSGEIADGRPLSNWVSAVCLHTDFTLDNHNRVHPDYLSAFTLSLRNASCYRLAGRAPPRAAFHHAADAFGVLKHLCSPGGGLFYINGQDWWPHRNELALFAGGLLGVMTGDREAAFLQNGALKTLGHMHTRFDDGRCFDPRETNYPNIETEIMARYGELYLAHRLFGGGPRPVTARRFETRQAGARVFNDGGFVTHRTSEKFASFAWKNGAMGLVFPDHDTWFTAPYERGLTGVFEVEGRKDDAPKVVEHKVRLIDNAGRMDGFAVCARITRCGGAVEQDIAMFSLPEGPVVYLERLRAAEDLNLRQAATGALAFLNEPAPPMSVNRRQVWAGVERHEFVGAADLPECWHYWKTPWANVDGRLGITACGGSGVMAFRENHAYERARVPQELYVNCLRDIGPVKRGAVFSELALVVLPGAGRRQTALPVRLEKPSPDALAARFGKRFCAANWGPSACELTAGGKQFVLPPMETVETKTR